MSRREWLAVAPAASAAAVVPRRWNQAVPLGNTDLRVTPLGMGCEDARDPRLIARAVELGINYFHCFRPLKGGDGNLTVFGEAVQRFRSRIVISTGSAARTREALNADLEEMLRLLKTDTIDLWYLSSRQKPEHLPPDVLEAARDAKRAGKIRAVGITTHSFTQLQPFLCTVTDVIDGAMITCNFASWSGPAEFLAGFAEGDQYLPVKKARQAGLGIVAMKPMLGGLGFLPVERKAWAARLTELQRRDALAAAVRWVVANPHVDTAPVSMRSLEQLEGNIAALQRPPGGDDRQLLSMTLRDIGPYYCRMCNRCEGTCRRQLPVADLMRFVLYHDGYGDVERAHAAYRLMPDRIRRVRCQDCATCTVTCPNGVHVQEQIVRAQAVLA